MKLTSIFIVSALVISLIGCESRTASDTTITTTVKNKLATDPETSATKINVDTSGGVVTLSGAAQTAAEKAEAERLARNTTGVRQVVNNITVEGEQPAAAGGTLGDATILSNIKTQFVANGIFGTNVDVKNGDVTITGAVENAQEKAKAEEIARQASGVKSVKNQLTIKKK
jgi:osmotically-inducible protein OsmY